MRAAFVTCVQLGLACMQEIYNAGGSLIFAMTLHDEKAKNKSGRIYLDEFCSHHTLPLVKVNNVNDPEAVAHIAAADLDWLFIIGWSQIAKRPVLDAVRRGVLGMHPTLLPEGRGRAAIPWAILKGLSETGVTLFQLDDGVDTGPILAQERIAIAPDETATHLYTKVADTHRVLMRNAWPRLQAGTLHPHAQSGPATFWPGRTPADGEIHGHMTVLEIDRLVRATTRPYPGAFLRQGDYRLRIWGGRPASTSEARTGTIRIQAVDGFYEATEYERILEDQ